MELRLLKPKDLYFGIKNGVGLKDFLFKYECAEEELKNYLYQIYNDPKKVEKFIRKLRKNDRKRRDKAGPATPAVKPEIPSVTEVLATQVLILPVRVEELELELKKLEAKAQKAADEIKALEHEYADLSTQGRIYLERLSEASTRVSAAAEAFINKYADYNSIMLDYGEITVKINKLFEARQRKATEFDETCEKIRQLKKITIYVYSDGTIAGEDNKPISDAPGSEELWKKLLEAPECEDLSVKEVRLLARVLGIVKSSPGAVDVNFEDDWLGEIYEKLI